MLLAALRMEQYLLAGQAPDCAQKRSTPTGGTATVLGGHTPQDRSGWMWDLTIPGDHDFYIDTTAALVHNCPTNLGRGSTGRTEPANLKNSYGCSR